MATSWNYNRINANGYLCSYYGKGQEWSYTERGQEHRIRVECVASTEYGVQYYFVSIDGKFNDKRLSAARLHYVLHQKQAVEISPGVLQPLTLQADEVREYFRLHPEERADCAECGGTGIDDRGKICYCTRHSDYDIKHYFAEKRLEKLTTV